MVYAGLSLPAVVAVPLGDEQFTLPPGQDEFTVGGYFGFDITADIGPYVQTGFGFHFGPMMGFLDAELHTADAKEAEEDMFPFTWRAGLLTRAFPLGWGVVRPFIGLSAFVNRMSVVYETSGRMANCTGECGTSKEWYSRNYEGFSIVPALGVRFDPSAGDTLFPICLEVGYSVNLWQDLDIEVQDETSEVRDASSLRLDHLMIMASIGFMVGS